MKRVRRENIVDWQTYGDRRDAFRERVLAAKVPRRIHLADVLTILFENALTVQYQIQEMVRAERIVRESDIQHEIDTYNEILGEPGELGCTLLVEIDDPEKRAAKLREWFALPEHVYVRMEDGRRIAAQFDARQRGEDKLSAVQFLRFAVGGEVPVAVGVDLESLRDEAVLAVETRRALADDLAGECNS